MVADPTPGPVQIIEGYGLGDAPADGSVLPWSTVVEWLTDGPQLLGHDDPRRRAAARDAGVGTVARRRAVVLVRSRLGEGPQPRGPPRRGGAPRER